MANDPPSGPLFFTDHRDVQPYLNNGENLVLARRRVTASGSDYELIKAFTDRAQTKNYAATYILNWDKYVILFRVTDSQLQNISL